MGGTLTSPQAAGRIAFEQGERAMNDDSDDFTEMNDPDFLTEYGRVRDTLEALANRMRKMTEEFDRRAGAKWASASQG